MRVREIGIALYVVSLGKTIKMGGLLFNINVSFPFFNPDHLCCMHMRIFLRIYHYTTRIEKFMHYLDSGYLTRMRICERLCHFLPQGSNTLVHIVQAFFVRIGLDLMSIPLNDAGSPSLPRSDQKILGGWVCVFMYNVPQGAGA